MLSLLFERWLSVRVVRKGQNVTDSSEYPLQLSMREFSVGYKYCSVLFGIIFLILPYIIPLSVVSQTDQWAKTKETRNKKSFALSKTGEVRGLCSWLKTLKRDSSYDIL